MTALDADYLNRAAPPGSMRYFALLYTAPSQRDLLTALFVVEAEIRASATQVAHEVAHTRLHWWRGEIDRLVNRNAQHPATRILQSSTDADFSPLHALLVAADMDLGRMTYNNAGELEAYLWRSGATIWEVFAQRSGADMRDVRKLGVLIRRVETLRDVVVEARAGRIYWPLDELHAKQVAIEQLRESLTYAGSRELIATEITRIRNEFAQLRSSVRPLNVLAQLHARLLRRIERAHHDVFTQRHELGPLEKVWTAWRAARRS